MKTVTIEEVENGFLIKHDDRIFVANELAGAYGYSADGVGAILKEIFKKPEPVTELKAA